jgi:hypothetical protein
MEVTQIGYGNAGNQKWQLIKINGIPHIIYRGQKYRLVDVDGLTDAQIRENVPVFLRYIQKQKERKKKKKSSTPTQLPAKQSTLSLIERLGSRGAASLPAVTGSVFGGLNIKDALDKQRQDSQRLLDQTKQESAEALKQEKLKAGQAIKDLQARFKADTDLFAKKIDEEVEKIKKELADTKKAADDEIADIRAKLASSKTLSAIEKKSLEDRLAAKEKERQDEKELLEARLAELAAEKEEKERLIKETADAEKQIILNQLSAERIEANNRIKQAQIALENLEIANQELKKILAEKDAEIAAKEKEIEEAIKRTAEEKDAQIAELEAQYAGEDQELFEAEKEQIIAKSNQEIANLQAEIDNIRRLAADSMKITAMIDIASLKAAVAQKMRDLGWVNVLFPKKLEPFVQNRSPSDGKTVVFLNGAEWNDPAKRSADGQRAELSDGSFISLPDMLAHAFIDIDDQSVWKYAQALNIPTPTKQSLGSGYEMGPDSLSTQEIADLAENYFGIEDFMGVFAADMLPDDDFKDRFVAIVNTEPHNIQNGHWVGLIVDESIMFYDPLGQPPNEWIIKWLARQPLKGMQLKINQVINQPRSTNSSNCGWHVLRFLADIQSGKSWMDATGYTAVKEKMNQSAEWDKIVKRIIQDYKTV